MSFRCEKQRFVLNADAAQPAEDGENQGAPLLVNAEYSPRPASANSGFVGTALEGRLVLEDANGDRISESDYDSTLLVGMTFRTRF